MQKKSSSRSAMKWLVDYSIMAVGAFMVVYALEVFLMPHKIIDGGIIGISIIIGRVFGNHLLYPMVLILSLPFMVLAKKHLGKSLIIKMGLALLTFGFFGWLIPNSTWPLFHHYEGDILEVVVIGGLILGMGAGVILRSGGCLDGTEILGILVNKKFGFTVGSVVLFCNSIIFLASGFIFDDWQPALQSMVTFLVASTVMDMTIRGLEDSKCVQIFSSKPREVADALMHELKIGLTIINGVGGFSQEKREILFLVAERLQLSSIKAIVDEKDPNAHIIVTNVQDIFTNSNSVLTDKKKQR